MAKMLNCMALGCINVYSAINPFIDFVIVPYGNNFSKAEDIIQQAYDEYWEEDNESFIISEYIGNKLKENDIDYEIYYQRY